MVRSSHLSPLCALLGAALLIPHATSAAEAPRAAPRAAAAPTRATPEALEAKRHFQQAVALHREGNLAGALAEFRAAHELWAKTEGGTLNAVTALYNVGALEKELFRYTDAIASLRRFLAESEALSKLTRTQAAEVRTMRSEAHQLVTEMTALLAPIALTVEPGDAQVLMDGRAIAAIDRGRIELPPGAHVLEVSAEGHHPERREISVVAGRPIALAIRLRPIPRTGHLVVTSQTPLTQIFIDGQDRGAAPVTVELPAGGHRLEARAPGHLPHASEVALAVGQRREIKLALDPPPPPPPPPPTPLHRRWWFWGAVGAAVAGGVATAIVARPGSQPALVGTWDPGVVSTGD
jgi:hypothetical protein